jgi:translocation and assembly module TamB
LDAKADLRVDGLATGIAPFDRLHGGVMTLTGGLFTLPRGGFGFDDFLAKGAHLRARLDGQSSAGQMLIDATAAISDLRQFDGRMTGTADLQAKVTGSQAHPNVSLKAIIPQATALKRPLRDLTLVVEAQNMVEAPQATVNLSGDVAGKPAKGVAKIARAGRDWRVDGLDLSVGSVLAKGALSAGDKGVDGALTIRAKDLDDVSALALTQLDGDLDAVVTLRAEGGQTVALKATSQRLKLDDILVDRLAADVTARDVLKKPALQGALSIQRVTQGAKELAAGLKLDAKPDGTMSVAGRAQGFDLSGAGRLAQTDSGARVDLSHFEARKGAKRVALAQPGAVALDDGVVTLRRISLALDGGRLDLDGRVSPTLDLTANARAVPLSIADLAKPGLGLSGVIDATAHVAGSPDAPRGDWKVAIRNLSAPALRGASLPALQLDASGRLGDGRTTLDAAVQGPRLGPIRATGSAPVDGSGALDLRVQGKVDLALANSQLGAGGRRVAGFAEIDARVTGDVARPQIQGGATLAGASFQDAETGLKLENLRGRILGAADELRLEGVTASTPNGGSVSVTGRVGLGEGMPGAIKVTATNAQLMNSSIATAVADVNLDVSGPFARRPVVAGRVAFSRLDVSIPENLPASSRPLGKVTHLNAPAQVKKRLAQQAKAKKASKSGGGVDAQLDLRISAPNRVFVRGRGVDAELGGELTIKGAAADPRVVGGFDLRRGSMAIGGRRLQFTRAKLVFSGSLEPELDFLAQNQASDAQVFIALSGPAAAPDFKFYSEPDYPQDEVLARLLFGKSAGGLTTAQALQIAMLAAQFAGGGDGAFENMRKQLGVDSLDVGLGADGGVGVGASKAINDRISVGVKAGAKPADTGVSVDVDLSRRLRLQGAATADGNTSVGVGFEMEY